MADKQTGELLQTLTEGLEGALEALIRADKRLQSLSESVTVITKILDRAADVAIEQKKAIEGLEFRVRELEGRTP